MATPPHSQLADALREWLSEQIHASDAFRRFASELGRWLTEATANPEGQPEPAALHSTPGNPPVDANEIDDGEVADAEQGADSPRTSPAVGQNAAIVPLKIGGASAHVTVAGTTSEIGRARAAAQQEHTSDDGRSIHPVLQQAISIDLSLVETRSRLKAVSCGLLIRRRAADDDLARQQTVVAEIDEAINRARAMPQCFLWCLWREHTQPSDDTLRIVEGCYTALADAAGLVELCNRHDEYALQEDLENAIQLLAEASSALRIVLLERTWLSGPDQDQDDVHQWLSRETAMRRIFVKRFMKLDDPADPDAADTLSDAVRAVSRRIEDRIAADRKIVSIAKRVCYHVDALRDSNGEPEHHFKRISEGLAELTRQNIASTDRRARDVVVSLTSLSADGLIPAGALGPEAATWFAPPRLAPEQMSPATRDEAPRQWSARVIEARRLIRGTDLVVVGGERRPDAVDRIRDAFQLRHVEWVRLTEHGSGEPMRAPIGRPTTSAVVVLIKLAGHLHVETARAYAARAGRPCVLLKAGYNPEQIAEAILQQAADHLERDLSRLASADVSPADSPASTKTTA